MRDVDQLILRHVGEKLISKVALYVAIVHIVQRRQRDVRDGRGVLPVAVQSWLNEYRAEQTLRREMSYLARQGVLERVGGKGCRRGYRIPKAENFC
ncbi:MAG: hypothetical protein L6Q98_23560 [Anaerolineae bacterium]|nr:hypothetical protein [Anaerolineae bacterium]NUQ06368.1 hypothetical protein [Anaerolineae bacterium]